MATIAGQKYYESGVASVKENGTHHYVYLNLNDGVSNLVSSIPAYSRINNAVLTIYADTSTASNKAAFSCSLTNSNGGTTYLSDFIKNESVGGNGSGTTNYTTIPYNVTKWLHSENANVGKINGYGGTGTYIQCHFNLFVLTKYTFAAKYTLYYEWLNPSVTVTVTGDTGGTVEGSGTYYYDGSSNSFTIKATALAGYEFVKWSDGDTNASRTITVDSSFISAFENSKSYHAVFKKLSYTVKFVNHDGTVLQTSTVEHGSTPSYTKATPTKPATAQYTYTFSGWNPSIGAISGNTTYTAQFTATKRKYTINFVNYDNSPLETKEVEYGVKPTYTGATPKKSSDAQYDYVFSTWTPSIVAVTGAATYKAVFNSVIRYYTVSVIDGIINLASGNLADGKYSYGSILKIIANEKVGYKFVNWSGNSTSTEKEISHTVTGDASFIANYRTLQMKFKSVKILHHSSNEVASPTNPLVGGKDGDQAIIKVEIALE